MSWLWLEAIAETPIALPRRAQAGNLYETLPEIPGTAVRGAFAGRYLREHGWEGQPLSDEQAGTFEPLFERPAVRFGPLRPVPDDLHTQLPNVPVLPVPRSASSCKYDGGLAEGHGVLDGLLRQTESPPRDDDLRKRKCPGPNCGAPLEPLDSTWLLARWNGDLQGGQGRDYDPVVRLSTHVSISAVGVDGAGMADEGRLFSLQHFPAGTRFRGWVAVGDDAPGDLSALGLDGTSEEKSILLRVGRRRNSYGALKAWVVDGRAEGQDDHEIPRVTEKPPWEHSHGTPKARWEAFQKANLVWPERCPFKREEAHLFSLTCVTDLILLDDFLRPARAITAAQAAKWLGVSASSVWRLGLVTGTRVISGWNAAHCLPKENDVVITAGSVFLFAVKKDALMPECLLGKLAAWENQGRGWRRSEGFGQVLVCDPWHLTGTRELDGVEREGLVRLQGVRESDLEPTEEPRKFDEEVLRFLANNAQAISGADTRLSRTQLNGLRDRAQRLDAATRLPGGSEAQAKSDLKAYLEHAGKKAKDSSPWNRKAGNQRLPQALIRLFDLEGETKWPDVLRRIDDFVTGALLLTAPGQRPDLRALCAKQESVQAPAERPEG